MFDESEYERIVREYAKALYRYCLARTHDKELAEETLNDVFEVLFVKWDSLNVGDNIRAYLYRVADNCIKHNLQKKKRYYEKTESFVELVEKGILTDKYVEDDYFGSPDMTESRITQIHEALDEESKLLFKYRYIEKLTLNEVSQKLGVPYSTLRYRLFKLEEQIKNIVSNFFD